jgi:biotin transport system substrate-specific component
MVLAALFTGLMVAGSLITIPFPQVPMVIANAFPWLAGLLLGPLWAGVSTGLFLLLGAFGLPVYAKGGAGIGVLFGNTGGFLFGYLLAAILTGLIAGRARSLARNTVAVLVGLIVVYAVGVPWLSFVAFKGFDGFTGEHLLQALVWGTGPGFLFVIGDLIKAVGVLLVATALERIPAIASLRAKS